MSTDADPVPPTLADMPDTRPSATPADAAPLPRFEKYDVLDELGRGGMGIVYRARQKGLDRLVALKVLGAGGLASREEIERFRREAHAAARLRHPGIVEVFDVGEMEGRPYLAMEFVEGLPLDAHAARVKPDLRTRVDLLRRVAEAVAHAHAQGVVHRDLKPGNVLVDRAGNPHVADFGLAKEVREGSDTLTRSGAVLGTPQYMSPEQAEGESRDIDARSDVFSLGAMLYETLAGRRPFEGDGVMAILMKVIAADPAPPRAVNPRVHADLETICLKALEKDRARRYASASELAGDLARFLAGEPIEARPVGRVSRMYMKARRHPAIAALWATVAAGACLAVVLAFQVARKADEASLAQEQQRREQHRREAVERVLYLFETARALVYDGSAEPVEIKERARRVIAEVDQLLPDDPGDARLYSYRGKAQRLMGADDAAEQDFDRAVALDPQSGPAQFELGCLALERVLDARLAYDAASRKQQGEAARDTWMPEVRRRFALAASAGNLPRKEKALAEIWGLWAAGKEADAEAVCTREIDRGGQVEDFLLMRGSLHAGTERGLQDYTAAVDRAPNHARLRLERGIVRSHSGNLRGAVEDYTKALDLGSRSAPWLYLNRSNARHELKDLDGALADCTRVIELRPDLAEAYHNRAAILAEKGDDAAAIADLTKAIELKPDFAFALRARGSFEARLGRTAAALADFTRAIEIQPDYVAAWACRARLRREQQDFRAALEDANHAVELQPDNLVPRVERLSIYKSLDDREGVRRELEKIRALNPDAPEVRSAVDWLQQAEDPGSAIRRFSAQIAQDPKNAVAWRERGISRLLGGDPALAVQDLLQAIQLDPQDVNAHENLGVARIRTGDPRGGIADLTRAIELSPKDATAYGNRGVAHSHLQEHEAALADLNRALELQGGDANLFLGRGRALLNLKRPADALRDFDAALARHPDWIEAVADRAEARVQVGDDRAALADMDFVLAHAPDATNAWLSRSRIRLRLGDPHGALEDATRYRQLAPQDPFGALQRGVACYRLGDWKSAAEECSKALAMNTGLVEAYGMRAAARQRCGDSPGAIEDFTRAIDLGAKNAQTLVGRAIAHQTLGHLPETIQDCTLALEVDANFAYAYGVRGQARGQLGQFKDAVPDLEKAIQIQPALSREFGASLEEARAKGRK